MFALNGLNREPIKITIYQSGFSRQCPGKRFKSGLYFAASPDSGGAFINLPSPFLPWGETSNAEAN